MHASVAQKIFDCLSDVLLNQHERCKLMTRATTQFLQRMNKPILNKKIRLQTPIAAKTSAETSALELKFSNLWRNYLGKMITDHDFLVEMTGIRHDLSNEHRSLSIVASDEFRRQKQLSPSAVGVLRAVQSSPMSSTVIDSVRLLVIGLVKAEDANDTEQIVSMADKVCR